MGTLQSTRETRAEKREQRHSFSADYRQVTATLLAHQSTVKKCEALRQFAVPPTPVGFFDQICVSPSSLPISYASPINASGTFLGAAL